MPEDRTWFRRSGTRLFRWWLLVCALAAIGALAAHTVSPELGAYRASTTILVGAPIDAPFQQVTDIDASEHLARVFVDVIPQEQVLDGVIRRLALDTTWRQLRARVDTAVEGKSQRLLLVTATADSAAEAEAIVGEIPRQLQAVAFGRGGAPKQARARGFIWSRMEAMQRHIVGAQRAVVRLRRQVASDPLDAERQLRLEDARSLLRRWDQAFTSMYRNLEHEGSADHVEVVDAPARISGPASQLSLDVAAGVGGAMIALIIASIVEFGGRRRLHRRRIPAAVHVS
jgi:hypothetical protein